MSKNVDLSKYSVTELKTLLGKVSTDLASKGVDLEPRKGGSTKTEVKSKNYKYGLIIIIFIFILVLLFLFFKLKKTKKKNEDSEN